jgi:hypothetical protein
MRRILRSHGWPEDFDRGSYLQALLSEHPDNVARLEALRKNQPHLVQAFKDEHPGIQG